jgi:hypothetical protein
VVPATQQAHLEPAELDLRSRLDHSLPDDGSGSLAGLVAPRYRRRPYLPSLVCRSVTSQRRLDVVVLWPSSDPWGADRYRDPMAYDSGYVDLLLGTGASGGYAVVALSRLGFFCSGAELDDLADESLAIQGHFVVAQPSRPADVAPLRFATRLTLTVMRL